MTLFTLFREHILRARIAYYEWALNNIDPLHDDVPEIIRHIHRLRLDLMDVRRRLA